MEHEFKIQDKTYKLKIESKGSSHKIDLDGKRYDIDAELMDGQTLTAHLAEKDGKFLVNINGESFCIEKPEEKSRKSFAGEHTHIGEKNFVSTPMPGKIVKISAKVGEEVRKNQTLVIVEAMKMENEIKSPIPAKVKKINFKEGQPIVELEPKEGFFE
jgi:biotin carboxyl carrier protein